LIKRKKKKKKKRISRGVKTRLRQREHTSRTQQLGWGRKKRAHVG